MSGQLADADAALLEAERLGASLAERRFVAGILSHYRGDVESAKRLLLEACGERPDWVAPRAFLSVVCDFADDYEGEAVHANKAFALKPVTDEDYLFRGYMIGYNDPRRGLPDLEEAWTRRRSVLAQFIRAEVLMMLADDTGRIEDAEAAREALHSARSLMGDAPMAAVSNLFLSCVGCNNCRLHGSDKEARQWLAEADADFHAAQAFRARPGALQARSLYLYLQDGNARSLDEENQQAGRKGADGSASLSYLASLFQRGKTEDALEYLPPVRDNEADILPFARVVFLLDRRDGVAAARGECQGALHRRVRSRYCPYLCYALSLAGRPGEARIQAEAFRNNPLVLAEWDEFGPFVRRVAAHAYEDTPLDVDREIGDSRWKRFIAYDTLGFAALGRGERKRPVSCSARPRNTLP